MSLINFASTLAISSTHIVARTFKPCKVFFLYILTQHAPWPIDLDLYFTLSDFDKFHVNPCNLINYSCYNLQTLHSVSSLHPHSACTLSRWPWPIVLAALPPSMCSTAFCGILVFFFTDSPWKMLWVLIRSALLMCLWLMIRRSWIQSLPCRATFFHRDWSWKVILSLPLRFKKQLSVSDERMCISTG